MIIILIIVLIIFGKALCGLLLRISAIRPLCVIIYDILDIPYTVMEKYNKFLRKYGIGDLRLELFNIKKAKESSVSSPPSEVEMVNM